MFSTTPHKKSQNVLSSTPFASPSFTSLGSSFKRKRDQIERSDKPKLFANPTIVIIRKDDILSVTNNDEILLSKVFTSGDILLLKKVSGKPTNLSLFHEAHKGSYRTTNIAWPLSPLESLEDAFDIGKTFNSSTDLISCSKNGVLILINIAADGVVNATEHKVLLGDESERVTSICHAGNVLLLGTSTEDLYLIRREGKAVSADRLQRTQSVFFGLLQSGAKLIGILPGEKNKNRQIVKMIPVPMSHLLLSIGNTLTLWSDWSSPGREKVVWDFKLKQILRDDLKALGMDVTKMRIVDACLMPTETGARKAVLLVLSVSSDALSEEDYLSATQLPCSLWMHTLEVHVPPTGTFQQGPGTAGDQPVSIMHRVLVGEDVQFNLLSVVNEDGSVTSELGVTQLKPRISSLHPSWRVYLSWSGFNVNLSTYTLQSAQFDVLNQPVIDLDSLMSGDGTISEALEFVRCTHSVDSGIQSTTVVDSSAVEGLDGVVVLINDGALLLVSPPLPDRAPRDFPAVKDAAQIRHTAPVVDPKTLLMAIAAGEVDETDSLRELRDLFVTLSPQNIAVVLQEVSHRILNRAPTGQYWGTSSSLRGLTGQALTRYQMVHRLVEDKADCHRRLLRALDSTNIFSFEEVRVVLFSEHQQLLLCAGLSGAVQESQMRLSNATTKVSADFSPVRTSFLSAGLLPNPPQSTVIGSSDPSTVFSVAAHGESLKVIATGMDLAVRRMRRVSLEDIESQGLSVVDQFYSEASQISDGVLAIAMALQEAQNDSPSLFHAAYGVASTLLAAVTFANTGEGASLYSSSIMCHPKTRQALLQVVEMLHVGLHKLGGELPTGFSLQREGKRLNDFCSLVLTTFVVDATHEADNRGDAQREDVQGSGEGGEHMSAEWKAQYHAAKTSCVTLLLAIKHAQAAFALSDEHLLFSGLMESVELDATSLQLQLEAVVRTKGFVVGTDDVPLATACLLWLEENKRPAVILSLGALCKHLLDKFLETRPQLAWMNHLRHARYSKATSAAVSEARHVPNKVKAQSLLSIAKLSSILASSDEPGAKQLNTTQSDEKKNHSVEERASREVLEESVVELKANLAVLKCQEQLQTLCPSEFPNPELRVNVSDLVGLVTRIILTQQDNRDTQQEEIVFDRVLSADDVVNCFGIGLSLLHMELEVVESIARAAEAPSSSSIKRAASIDLTTQTNVLRGLLVSLWGALVTAQTGMWVEMSAIPNLSRREEDILREECLLFKALVSVCGEVAQGNMRESLLPGPDGELLDAMIVASGVTERQVDSEGNEVHRLDGNTARNQRVVYILKVCVEMALSERVDGEEMGGIEQQ